MGELRERCGGVLYWEDKLNKVVFVTNAEWQLVLAERDARDAEARALLAQQKAEAERVEKRLSDIVAIARADSDLWDKLRATEIEHKAALEKALASDMTEFQRILREPVDPLFVEFGKRMHDPREKPTLFEIIVRLKQELDPSLAEDSQTSIWVLSVPRS